ncbi:Gastricsin [Phytophthora citrophthora]|uniref:Gastricsin n=1 Tax=Phytophthora citrophthora TaxID=4793 RepID=A0AAD9G886_9STRA|nr:Gastricsin [Phytophthora citrophthora]
MGVVIPLETTDQLRFTGAAHFGSPPRSLRVVFDTGSSDTWISSSSASAVDKAEVSQRTPFAIRYGGGVVSGTAAAIDLRLANQFLLSNVHVGVVDDATSVLAELDAQGVVGLGLEALAQIHTNSNVLRLLAKQKHEMEPVVFSIYISSWSGAKPASWLIIGSQDEALTSPNATWFSFPVVPDSVIRTSPSTQSAKKSFGFWALRVQSLVLDEIVLPLSRPNSRNGIALLDSGTSMLLLPPNIFDRFVQTLSTRFGARFDAPLSGGQSLPVCRRCHVHEFPTFGFDFSRENSEAAATSQRFELQGSDYVRCDWQDCTAMIDVIQSTEVSDRIVLVLGSVFFRAFYMRFDYSNKQVSLACTLEDQGVCRGGLYPALDYHGQPYEPPREQTHWIWRGCHGPCASRWVPPSAAALRKSFAVLFISLYQVILGTPSHLRIMENDDYLSISRLIYACKPSGAKLNSKL